MKQGWGLESNNAFGHLKIPWVSATPLKHWSKRRSRVQPKPNKQLALYLDYHRIWTTTRRHTFKENSKIVNRDWVIHQACRLSYHIYIIAYAFISHGIFLNDPKIVFSLHFYILIYSTIKFRFRGLFYRRVQSIILVFRMLIRVLNLVGFGWLVDLGLTALWDSISVYIGPSPKEREKEERKDRGESKQPPPAPTASAIGPCPTLVQIVGRPGTGNLPSTITPRKILVLRKRIRVLSLTWNMARFHVTVITQFTKSVVCFTVGRKV